MKLMRFFLIGCLILGTGCSTIHPPRYEIRKTPSEGGRLRIWGNGRDDTKFEKAEQWAGLGLIMAGLPAFLVGFFGQMPDWTKYSYGGLGAMGFGIAISWDGMGAFQEVYETRKLRKKIRELEK